MNQNVKNSTPWRISNNAPLLDTPDVRKQMRRMSACSVRDLVQASKKGYFGRAGYDYSDFMYCKYLGRIPNNYLITLRRFAVPVMDQITPNSQGKQRKVADEDSTIQPNVPNPIGTMVTWLGAPGNEMKNILKYTYNMPFKEQTAGWEDIEKQGGDSGWLNGLEAMINPATRKQYIAGNASVPAANFAMKGLFGGAVGDGCYNPKDWEHKDKRKVYGPIDRIKKAYKRSEEGLDWIHQFSLVFEYELKAYNGINPRQAMLDLLANILAVTYTTGGFWKGGYKGGTVTQSSTFQNLAIFRTASKGGTFTEFMDAFAQDANTMISGV